MPAPRTLWVYIFRDVALHTLLALAALTLLTLVQAVLKFVDSFASAGVPFGAFFELASILMPRYSVHAVPAALLFGVLLSFGRMSADGEIIAMRSSGISVRRMLVPVLGLGLIATLITGYVVFEVEPTSRERMRRLEQKLLQSVQLIVAGEFRKLDDRTLYVHEAGDESCPLRGVLVSDASDAERTLYISARCGAIAPTDGGRRLALALRDGTVDFSNARTDRYRRMRFQSLETAVDLDNYLSPARRPRDYRFMELLDLEEQLERGDPVELRGTGDPMVRVQVQKHRRLAFPLASLALALLAVPLGIRPIRSGRSWGALTAIVVMGAYWVLSTVAEIAASSGLVAVPVALWAPDVLVIVLALVLVRRSARSDS